MRVFRTVLAALAAVFLLATCTTASDPVNPPPRVPPLSSLVAALPPSKSAERGSVRTIVERRCVVCHGCYDAPCQLKLSSAEGIARGAAKTAVYDTGRLSDAAPTRLGIDARRMSEWRALGFHPVVPDGRRPDPDASIMARLLALGRAVPPDPRAPVPGSLDLDIDTLRNCPAPDELDAHIAATPEAGMPYAMAALRDDEFAALGAWLLSGKPLPSVTEPAPPEVAERIAEVEAFLNAPGQRRALVARYLYEHLFLAHLHVEDDAPDRFFRLVRSRTPTGRAVDQIATRRPYDDPGGPVHYRIVPIDETILHKDHLVYAIGAERLARWRTLFLSRPWRAGEPPSYGSETGANPFKVFAAIPPEARYRFLLDDALFFVRSFIRGPVCHGQIATDVIEDRFWVAFLNPAADLSVTDPEFLKEGASLLKLPAATAEGSVCRRLWPILHDGHRAWLEYRDGRYHQEIERSGGRRVDAIWDGEGMNRQALLTVFRNFDNAAVVPGFVGAVPETAWVIDYPVFERIYYDLVAGYDVFGSVEHQLTTRLYMDHLRREGEDLFLSFLPPETRQALHSAWYRGPLAELHASWTRRRRNDQRPTGVIFATGDPKAELLRRILERGGGLWPVEDPINRCAADCSESGAHPLAALASREGEWVRLMPDLTLLRVIAADGRGQVFSLFHDKAHENVALLFNEASRREPAKDTLTILDRQVGSYPNFFLEVAEAHLLELAMALRAMRSQDDWLNVVETHGLRRTDPEFWRVADAMQDDMLRQDPREAGLLDLNRYVDPKSGEVPE